MNFQAFPDSCGYNVASWWCPLTDARVLISIIIIGAFLFWIYSIVRIANQHYKKYKQEKRVNESKDEALALTSLE